MPRRRRPARKRLPWLRAGRRALECSSPLSSRSWFCEREFDFEIIPVDDETNRSLFGFRAEADEKGLERVGLPLQRLFARVALDHDGLVDEELSTLRVVAPHSPPLRKCRGSAEQLAQDFQGFLDPVI